MSGIFWLAYDFDYIVGMIPVKSAEAAKVYRIETGAALHEFMDEVTEVLSKGDEASSRYWAPLHVVLANTRAKIILVLHLPGSSDLAHLVLANEIKDAVTVDGVMKPCSCGIYDFGVMDKEYQRDLIHIARMTGQIAVLSTPAIIEDIRETVHRLAYSTDDMKGVEHEQFKPAGR